VISGTSNAWRPTVTCKSLILSAALGLAALPLVVACSDDNPIEPQSVRARPDHIVISPAKIDLRVGLSARLKAYMMSPDGEMLAHNAVKWTSSDPGVVSVNNGRVFAKRAGIAVVTAGCGSMCGWAEVTVSEWDEGEGDADNGVH
jgi:hypothetical protein